MHDHSIDLKEKNLLIVIFLNLLIFISEVLGGIFSKSLSLLSDSFHNLSDTLSIIISLIAIRFSKKENSYDFTFGGKRAEILASFLNSIFLFFVSFILIREAILRIFNPQIINLNLMLIIALIGLLLNGVSVFLLKNFSKESLNIKSSYLHLLLDTFSSVAVVIGGILMMVFKIYWIDPILTILIIFYVLKEGAEIFIKSLKILLEAKPKEIDIEKIKYEIEKIDGILDIHHVHIWQLNDKDYLFEGHLTLKKDYSLSKVDEIRKRAEDVLKEKFNINHTTLQIEYNGCCKKDLITGEH